MGNNPKRKPGRPKKVDTKVTEAPETPGINENEATIPSDAPYTSLISANIPTWAYKKGHDPIVINTPEDLERYASEGWSDKP